jgi:predicted metal-binding membrane protein
MHGPTTLERVVRRDRLLMTAGLAATIVLAWAYLIRAAADMQVMASDAQMHAAMGMADIARGVLPTGSACSRCGQS